MTLRLLAFSCALLAAPALANRALPQSGAATAPWALTDLRILTDTLRARHPKLLIPAVRQRFDSVAADVERRIATLPRARAILELARVLATLEDGHTQLGLAWDKAISFRRYPFRIFLFEDGIYVVRAASTASRMLGTRLVRIGTLPIDSVIARLRPFLHGDNDMNRQDILETRLTLHEVLRAVGATGNESATFVFVDSLNRSDSLTLVPLPFGATPRMGNARDTLGPPPLYLRSPERTYWFSRLPDGRVMYAQINAIANDSGTSLAQFVDSLFATIAKDRLEHLVLDLRLNNGGDNTLNRPLVQRLIRTPRIDRPGHLYVIIGRKTFSAAVNLVSDLEAWTHAIFVGEPTGAPANHYGETTRLPLPGSGITALYSSLLWQGGDPRDTRPWIAPSLNTPPRFRDYRANRDAALEAVLAQLRGK